MVAGANAPGEPELSLRTGEGGASSEEGRGMEFIGVDVAKAALVVATRGCATHDGPHSLAIAGGNSTPTLA